MVVSLADVLADQRVAMRPLISLAFTRLMTEVCIENKDQLVLRPGETSDDVVSQPPTPNPPHTTTPSGFLVLPRRSTAPIFGVHSVHPGARHPSYRCRMSSRATRSLHEFYRVLLPDLPERTVLEIAAAVFQRPWKSEPAKECVTTL